MEGGGKGKEEKGMLAEFRHVQRRKFMDGGKGEGGKGGKRT